MSVKIQIRRGTRAQLDAYGALSSGELGFTTDEKMVYVGDGSNNYTVGEVRNSESDPSGGISGTLHVNTLTNKIFFHNGTAWVQVGAGSLDNIPDGSSYQRVAAADVDSSGHVSMVYDGATQVTATTINTHLTNASKHYEINDSGTGNTDLWSASKIAAAIHSQIDGLDWQDSVLDRGLTAPPGTPAEGARYLVAADPTGAWADHAGHIAVYRSAAWTFITPNKGFVILIEDENIETVYNGSAWVDRATAANHNTLTGLQGGQATEYYHLTLADYGALVTNRSETIEDIASTAVAGGTKTGISITYQDATSVVDFAVAYGTEPGAVSSSTSGAAGTADSASRSDHSHDLGSHDIVSLHSAAGLTAGHVMRASAADAFGFASLQSADLPSHKTRHQHGGDDEVATATAAANSIPKSGAGGTIDAAWLGAHNVISGHNASGLTAGHVIRATAETTFGFGALQSSDLASHSSRHKNGGDDEVATATGGTAYGIPKAGSDGKLSDAWLPVIDGGTMS